MPASRKARAITLAPRSCPSRPGFATSTRIFVSAIANHLTTDGTGFTEAAKNMTTWRFFSAIRCADDGYRVLMSRLRHIYQHATLRYGAQALAIFSISFGFGSLRFL